MGALAHANLLLRLPTRSVQVHMRSDRAASDERRPPVCLRFTAQGAGALGLSVLGFAAAVQVAGWAVQLGPGHAFFERRKPALADSLVQARAPASLTQSPAFLRSCSCELNALAVPSLAGVPPGPAVRVA